MTAEPEGSTALVTGATAGIGRAVVLRLAALGASVIVHGRDEQRGAETAERLRYLRDMFTRATADSCARADRHADRGRC
ncbi:SDR family NAD(P)-dependent oxidoreductase [Streptomyces sp. NPDC051452]|uniref:SDR family NAD(P)-dependent oxidoreductase n=1 Tax=Streptomyces sp. NPDC051452 TaxID=3365654 RepID=UPI0037A37A35